MPSEIFTYLRLGISHILDLRGYDHILFVIALVAGEVRHPKRLIWLVTAFTVGHSITLALATLDHVRVDPLLIETLIPLTIVVTSGINVAEIRVGQAAMRRAEAAKYGLALAFGLIHGLGFSNFLRATLGSEESILLPLLGFNMGVEIGQLAIVLAAIVGSRVVVRAASLEERDWLLLLSGATGGIAFIMMLQRLP